MSGSITPGLGVLLVASALGILLQASAPTATQVEPPRSHDPDWTAPPDMAAVVNPLRGRPETAAGGAKLFQSRCASCHATDGQGTSKAPDLTQAAVQEQTDGALFWKISSGNAREGMPAFSFLPAAQRWQLVLHLRSGFRAGR